MGLTKEQSGRNDHPDVSLVIPCYNEKRIDLSTAIKKIKKSLDLAAVRYEIIIIDDKSKDDTGERIGDLCAKEGGCRCYFNDSNIGRGGTVAKGIRLAKGEIVGYLDIDLSISPEYLPLLLEKIKTGADLVIARRKYKLNIFSFHRWILTGGYKLLVRIFLSPGLGDTESGYKFFKKEKVLMILDGIEDKKWFWDTELAARSYLAGFKIAEVPVVFVRDSFHTSVSIINDSFSYFIKLIRFSREFKHHLSTKK